MKKLPILLFEFNSYNVLLLIMGVVVFFICFLFYKNAKAKRVERNKIAEWDKKRLAKAVEIRRMKNVAKTELLSLEADHKVAIIKVETLVDEKFFGSDVALETLKGTVQSDVDAIKALPEDMYDGISPKVKQVRTSINSLTSPLFSNYEYKTNIEKQNMQTGRVIEDIRTKTIKAKTAVEKLKVSYSGSDITRINSQFAENIEHLISSAKLYQTAAISCLLNNDFPLAIENYNRTNKTIEEANKTIEDVFVTERELFNATATIKSNLKEYRRMIESTRSIVNNGDVKSSTK